MDLEHIGTQGPGSVVTLPDWPMKGTPLRPALWHASALLAAGYAVSPSEYKHSATGHLWRTWHVSSMPLIHQPDPVLGAGADKLINSYNGGFMLRNTPGCPYLVAYHAARVLDILLAYRKWKGAPPITTPLAIGSQFCTLVPEGCGAIPIHAGGNERFVTLRDWHLAAAMVACGFPLDRALDDDDAVRLAAVEDATGTRESLLMPGLSVATVDLAALAVRQANEAAAKGLAAPELESPLPAAHAFHWALTGALRRERLRQMELEMGHDEARARRHIRRGESNKAGHAVVFTAQEYRDNEADIINHLRKL